MALEYGPDNMEVVQLLKKVSVAISLSCLYHHYYHLDYELPMSIFITNKINVTVTYIVY